MKGTSRQKLSLKTDNRRKKKTLKNGAKGNEEQGSNFNSMESEDEEVSTLIFIKKIIFSQSR